MTAADLQAEFALADAALARIEAHRALLADWSTRMNLVGPKELERYWARHARDSLQLLAHAPGANTWLDLGAGAGFPGLILAAVLADAPGAKVTLVESVGKKAAFLKAAAAAMQAPVEVRAGRAETVVKSTEAFDVVTARAFAPLSRLANHVKPLIDRGALGLFPKGSDWEAERAAAEAEGWRFELEALPSCTSPEGRILLVRRIEKPVRR